MKIDEMMQNWWKHARKEGEVTPEIKKVKE
jgi:hypothetical protein